MGIAGLIVVYLGSGPLDTLGTDLVVGAAPHGKAGSAGAASETAAELGTGLGIAVLGTLGTAIYQSQAARTPPADLPGEGAAAADESISGATAGTVLLGDDQTFAVREAVGMAFASGVQAVSIAGAAITAVLAVLAVRLLRNA